QHLVKGGGKCLSVVVLDGLLEFGPDVVPGQSVAILHFVLLSNSFIIEFSGTGGSARGSSCFFWKTFCMTVFLAAWTTGAAVSAVMEVAIPYSSAWAGVSHVSPCINSRTVSASIPARSTKALMPISVMVSASSAALLRSLAYPSAETITW